MLREQLRLRNQHIQQQRQELSDEKVPGDLAGTRADLPAAQYTGSLQVAFQRCLYDVYMNFMNFYRRQISIEDKQFQFFQERVPPVPPGC